MAETLVSPGVLARENDSSFVSQGPITAGAVIIGPTVKGPVEIPTAVTSYSQFEQIFGSSFQSGSPAQTYSYFTSIAAYNYFNNGGTSLLVARTVSGSYTSATASAINNVPSVPGIYATASKALAGLAEPIGVEFRIVDNNSNTYRFLPTGSGNYQDDVDGKLYFFASSSVSLATTLSNLSSKISGVTALGITSTTSTTTLILSGSTSGSAFNGYIFQTGSVSSFSTQATLSGGVNGIGSNAFVLETFAEGIVANSTSLEVNGSLPSGSADNVRWQVVTSNSSSGTFDLIIRQGNDTNLNPTVLETYAGLSLDPFSPNYVSKIIGDYKYTYQTDTSTGTAYLQLTGSFPNRSNYVRVKSVNITTPYYFQNDGTPNPIYTGSLPIVSSGSFGSAVGAVTGGANFYQNINSTNTQGLVGSNYTSSLTLLANQDDYKYNILLIPGIYNKDYTSTITTALTNTQNRGDNILVADMVAYGQLVSDLTGQAATRNTSYAATYWPWCQVQDPDSGQNVWVPASTVIAGVYAYNDSVSEPWFAPAGINRGGLSQVIRAERRLPQGDRDTLYNGKVNPIATLAGTGVVVFGQKTLQTRASALDRVNVRRLLISLKSYISQVANTLVFEQNTAATRNNFLAQVNPYLESVQQRQGLYAFKVIMDESNNTPTVIDQNQMVGQIYLQPTKTAEFIYLNFNITPTGAAFPA